MFRDFIDCFRTITVEMMIRRELEECQRDLLTAGRSKVYFTKMVEYHEARIKDLTKQLEAASCGGTSSPSVPELGSALPSWRS